MSGRRWPLAASILAALGGAAAVVALRDPGRESPIAPARPAPPPASSPASPASSGLSAAPSRELLGLALGTSGPEEIEQWLQSRGLSCEEARSPRRASTQIRCEGEIPSSSLPERQVRGRIDQWILARPDDGPLTSVSIMRRASLPRDAEADYAATVEATRAILGAPTRAQPIPSVVRWEAPLVHFATSWNFADLSVTVSAMKAGGASIAVSERWWIPGAEAALPERTGSGSPHGAAPVARPPGWNPHVDESATPPLR